MPEYTEQLYKQIKFYHSNKENKGSAISVRVAKRDSNGEIMGLTIEVAKQVDRKTFDWKNKIIVMLNLLELSNFVDFVYYSDKEKYEVYHRNRTGSVKTITFNRKPYGVSCYFTSTDESGEKNMVNCVLFKNELLILRECFSILVAKTLI